MDTEQNKSTQFIKYPVLFLHGFGCSDKKKAKYWGRIPSMFENLGCKVFFADQGGAAVTEENALLIKESINNILVQTGAQKVNIIAHSKGGLEARYVISTLGMAEKVASLTTISTPHRGSRYLNSVPRFMLKITAFFSHIALRLSGISKPQVYKVYISFRSDEMEKFNSQNPDSPLVYYQSYAFGLKRDFWLALPRYAVFRLEGENDGLVSAYSAEWGDFKGVIRGDEKKGITHMEEVDYRSRDSKKAKKGKYDILEIYKEIADTLHNKGF